MDTALPITDVDYIRQRAKFKQYQDDLLKGRFNFTLAGLLISACVAAAFKFRTPPPVRIATVAFSPILLFFGYKSLMPSKEKISVFSQQDHTLDGIALNLQDRMHVQEKEKHTKLWLAIVVLIVVIVAGVIFRSQLPQSIKITITGASVALILAAYIQLPYIKLKNCGMSLTKVTPLQTAEPPPP